jgi:hypothetical protein
MQTHSGRTINPAGNKEIRNWPFHHIRDRFQRVEKNIFQISHEGPEAPRPREAPG